MMFYKLNGNKMKGFSRLDYVVLDDDSDAKWFDGVKMGSYDFIEYEIAAKSQKNPSVFSSENIYFFVSEEVKEIIENLETSENLEFVPLVLKNKAYYLLNVLNNVECFDWENSKYEERKLKVIRRITRLVVKENCLGDRNVFKLKEFPFTIFFSEKAKTILEEKNFSGIRFLES